ncbi:MAG: DUF4331 family protein [Polyangiaceae bacterium]
MHKYRGRKTALVAGLATLAISGWWASSLQASDHSEAPLVQADAAQDLTDVYVFGDATKTTILVCWAGLSVDPDHKQGLGEPASTAGLYDPAALYTIHIDNDGDDQADIEIYWRYGQNRAGETGIQWTGIPGEAAAVVHPVEMVHDASGTKLWSGHADDPFFFDAQGYLESLATGDLLFDSTRDTLAGLNVTAAGIEIDTSLLGAGPIQVWATTSRKPGA